MFFVGVLDVFVQSIEIEMALLLFCSPYIPGEIFCFFWKVSWRASRDHSEKEPVFVFCFGGSSGNPQCRTVERSRVTRAWT